MISNVIVCVCRCHLFQAACWRQSFNSGTPGGASCAPPKSAPRIWSILFRQQVRVTPPELMCCARLIPSGVFLRWLIAGAGFFGLLDGTQEVLREMLPVSVQPHAWSSGVSQHNVCKSFTLRKCIIYCLFIRTTNKWFIYSGYRSLMMTLWWFSDVYSGNLVELADIDNVSQGIDYGWVNQEKNNEKERKMSVAGVLNPAACFHLGDVILFTVDTRHYPLYDL